MITRCLLFVIAVCISGTTADGMNREVLAKIPHGTVLLWDRSGKSIDVRSAFVPPNIRKLIRKIRDEQDLYPDVVSASLLYVSTNVTEDGGSVGVLIGVSLTKTDGSQFSIGNPFTEDGIDFARSILRRKGKGSKE